jgi:hypothetical protein
VARTPGCRAIADADDGARHDGPASAQQLSTAKSEDAIGAEVAADEDTTRRFSAWVVEERPLPSDNSTEPWCLFSWATAFERWITLKNGIFAILDDCS